MSAETEGGGVDGGVDGGLPPATPPPPPAPRQSGLTTRGRVRRTRAGAWWAGLVIAAVVAVLFLVFIIQNSDPVTIHFFGLEADLSLAVALLLAAVIGVLVTAAPGITRIVQLRRALQRNARREQG